MIILKRFRLVFTTVLLAIVGLLLITTDSFTASDDVFNVSVTGGADYDGYIFKLKADVEMTFSLDDTIDTIYEPRNLYSAPTIEDIKNCVNPDYIEYIEPDYITELFDTGIMAYTYNDPYYSKQWGIQLTRGESAWNYGLSAGGVVIGIIDSGLNSHEDINSSYVRTGKNLLDGSNNTSDTLGHGTQVTSVIAATNNNGKGISSLAYKATIVPLKVFETKTTPTSIIVSAIYEAVDTYGCDVINMSLGTTSFTITQRDACDYAASSGALLIAATGNEGNTTLEYPAAYDSVIGVGAITKDGVKASFSTYNSSVFAVAPGEDIYMASNASSTSYTYNSGTSFSSPYVASLAALAKAYNNSMTLSEFQTLLKSSAVDKGTSGYDTSYGWGLVDVGRFVYYLTGNDFFNFTDVSGNYAESSIKYCTRYGIFGGTTPTTFSPGNNITRADLVTVLGRLYEMSGGSIAVKNDSFSDTVNGSYYSKYVAWASENGIVGGYGDGKFGPKDSATREQMVVILYRYAVYSGENIGAIDLNVLSQFTDQASISSYAKKAMAWCVQNGIIGGTSPTTIAPKSAATRAQVATLIYRYDSAYSCLNDLAA